MADDGVIRDEYGVSFTAGKLNAARLYLLSAVSFVEERLFSAIPCDPWKKFES